MDFNSTNDAANAAAASTVAGGLALGMIIFWAVFGVLSLIFLIWWIFMIIDCSKREFPEKSTWLVILIVGFFIPFGVILATLLYYFMVYKKLGKGGGSTPAAPTPPPQQ